MDSDSEEEDFKGIIIIKKLWMKLKDQKEQGQKKLGLKKRKKNMKKNWEKEQQNNLINHFFL